ncbi:hypothetical protein O7599_11155 [Streptomyces sp. WMMC500]|uniref:hypothetical protein n=1 Tax=Streptomyces sp. WMMC500 TaxID=3015154 RepID=UPI00248CA98B|nr:hypothetical protein [Streptomyces sp. WMMC500]WBB63041.1 hypothetical protein O7599_11155 [Streptomyces sp. WMMC500]
MRLRRRIATVAVAVGALIAISAATTSAGAAGGSGQTLGVGDVRCTDQVRSDNGVELTGFLTYGTGEWTVHRSAAPGGAETELLRVDAGSLSGQPVPVDETVTATGGEDFHYRACLGIDQIKKVGFFSSANYRMSLTSTSPDAVTDIGPDTATLSPSALACGDQTFVEPGDTIRLEGSSTGPTQWFVSVTGHTNNYEGNWAVFIEDTEDIDRTVTLDPEITDVTACGWNRAPDGQVSLGFELSLV